MSRIAKFAPTLIFLAVWLFLIVAGRSAMLRDPGTLWHVAAGEKMLATGQIVRTDPFSFTFAGRPWVADQWLAECVMAAVHRLGGWDALFLLTTAFLAAVYAWIAVRLLRGGLHSLPTFLLLAVVLLLSAPQFHVRPLVLSIGFLVLTFGWLIDVEAGNRSIRQLWRLVPLFVLWTNLHGGVLGGLGTVGICLFGWCETWLSGKESPLRRKGDLIELLLLMVVLLATTLINPYGIALPRAWIDTLLMPLPGLISEHARLDWTEPAGWGAGLLALAYMGVMLGCLPYRPRITWILPLVWFVLTIFRVRNAPLFAATSAIAIADMLPHSFVGQWLERRKMLSLPGPSFGWRSAIVPLFAIFAMLAIQFLGLSVPLVGRGWARFDPARCPVELLPKLEKLNGSVEPGEAIFNDLNYGGFLIYHAPNFRVFIDDRCSLYGGDFLQAYDAARRENPEKIERWRQQYDFRYALVEKGTPFDKFLSAEPHWSPAAATPVAVLYRRRLGESPPTR